VAQPDPSLGIAVNFPTETVRNALLFAMQMGAPNMSGREIAFVKKAPGRRYFLDDEEQFQPPLGTLRLDRDGRPLNPEIRVEQTPDDRIVVDAAIEIDDASAEEMPVGKFRPVRATVTLMQQEYDLIQGIKELEYNGDRYGFSHEPEIPALFDLDFHVLVFYAIDES
jgi:hypothetical protein